MWKFVLTGLLVIGVLLASVIVFLGTMSVSMALYNAVFGHLPVTNSRATTVMWIVSTATTFSLLFLMWYWLRRQVARSRDSSDSP